MSHRKWRETKQQLKWWPDLALLGGCLVSLLFLCDILSGGPVQNAFTHNWLDSPHLWQINVALFSYSAMSDGSWCHSWPTSKLKCAQLNHMSLFLGNRKREFHLANRHRRSAAAFVLAVRPSSQDLFYDLHLLSISLSPACFVIAYSFCRSVQTYSTLTLDIVLSFKFSLLVWVWTTTWAKWIHNRIPLVTCLR